MSLREAPGFLGGLEVARGPAKGIAQRLSRAAAVSRGWLT